MNAGKFPYCMQWETIDSNKNWTIKKNLWTGIKELKPIEKLHWGSGDNSVNIKLIINNYPEVVQNDRLYFDETYFYIVKVDPLSMADATVCYCYTAEREID